MPAWRRTGDVIVADKTRTTARASDADEHASLIVLCAGGDRTALRRLYDVEAATMLGVATRMLRRRDLAEEAVQDAFLRIWRGAASYRPELGGGRTWVYVILRNRCLTLLRTSGREVSPDDDLPDVADDAPDPEAVVSLLSDTSLLRRCLETLDERRRGVLLLAYAHGLTHGEIAGKLGVPLGTTKTWIRRSLLALRECMG